jgi:hypothetical protein
MDPLHFDLDESDNWERYEQLCESKEEDWMGKKLDFLAQERQEDWYGKWVGEMVRIAKPGVPVILEEISPKYCDAYDDWGGVAKEFWPRAIEKYGWDIDPQSLEIHDDTIFDMRYHVFMRKNGERKRG